MQTPNTKKSTQSGQKITTYDIVAIAVMAAFVFVATRFFMVKIPTPSGATMVKLGNGFCALAGLLLGGWRGGLAAGIGCAMFDLTDPQFMAGAPLTFVRYFILGGVSGLISHFGGAKGTHTKRNIVSAVAGCYSYVALYVGQKLITAMLLGSAFIPAVIANSTSIIASVTNATVGSIVAVLLLPAFRRAMAATTMGERLRAKP